MADLPQIWKADHVRVTLFSRELWTVNQSSFLTGIVGVEVDSTSSRPAMAESSTGAVLDAFRRVEIKQQMNRLDFVVQPRLDQIPEDGPPLLQDAVSEMRTLVGWVAAWMGKQPPEVIRIAIGAGAVLNGLDRDWTYRKLGALLPMIQLDPVRHRDFQLRLNTPVLSHHVPSLEINALATWSAMFMQVGFFGVGGPAQLPGLGMSQKHFVHCALDVNTDAVRTEPLPVEVLVPTLDEVLNVSCQLLGGAK